MIDDQNDDILDLLRHSEPTAELYESLISYLPSHHHSAYENESFELKFLTAVKNMVSVIFTKWYVRRVMHLLH